MAFSDPMQE